MSNFMYNLDETEQLVYEINCGMSEIIRSAEYHFAHVFFVMEQLVSGLDLALGLCLAYRRSRPCRCITTW